MTSAVSLRRRSSLPLPLCLRGLVTGDLVSSSLRCDGREWEVRGAVSERAVLARGSLVYLFKCFRIRAVVCGPSPSAAAGADDLGPGRRDRFLHRNTNIKNVPLINIFYEVAGVGDYFYSVVAMWRLSSYSAPKRTSRLLYVNMTVFF